jgi:hypothetical protein
MKQRGRTEPIFPHREKEWQTASIDRADGMLLAAGRMTSSYATVSELDE